MPDQPTAYILLILGVLFQHFTNLCGQIESFIDSREGLRRFIELIEGFVRVGQYLPKDVAITTVFSG